VSTPDPTTTDPTTPAASGTTVAAILTQVATAEALAAACAIGKHVVVAVPSPIGAYAVLVDPSGDRPAELAAAVSGLVKTVPLILFEATDGHITASQWQAGTRGEDLPAALVLDGAPHEFEDVLLGAVAASDVEGAVSSKGISRWKAARSLAAAGRAPRGRR
jgi:hypothetical protein